MCSSEFMPPGCGRTIRKDKKGECGILIAVKECYTQLRWTYRATMLIEYGARFFLRTVASCILVPCIIPLVAILDQLNDLETSLKDLHDVTRNRRDAIIILAGDLYLRDITWENESMLPRASESSGCQKLIDILHMASVNCSERIHGVVGSWIYMLLTDQLLSSL